MNLFLFLFLLLENVGLFVAAVMHVPAAAGTRDLITGERSVKQNHGNQAASARPPPLPVSLTRREAE